MKEQESKNPDQLKQATPVEATKSAPKPAESAPTKAAETKPTENEKQDTAKAEVSGIELGEVKTPINSFKGDTQAHFKNVLDEVIGSLIRSGKLKIVTEKTAADAITKLVLDK